MIINWVVIGVVVLLGIVLLKMEHHGRKIKFVILGLVVLALYFSVNNFMNSGEADLETPKGIINSVYIYFGWFGETATELWGIGSDTVTMVGNAIKVNVTENGISG